MSPSHPGQPVPRRTRQIEGPERLQKILAAAGLGSRRQCEELIQSGRVDVDRKTVTELGTKADPTAQDIRVDGVALPRPRLVYFVVNKPPGILSTNNDPSGRPRVIDLVPYPGRLFTVGRLDMSSEGLILVTNDGDLADRLTHPRYGVEKTYQVEVAGVLQRRELEKLRHGVHLAEGFAKIVSVQVVRQYKQSTLLEIVLAEGRNREIRRILARVGHKVERLKRIAIGPLRLAELPIGHVRELDRDELKKLRRAAVFTEDTRPARPAKRRDQRPKAAVAAPPKPTRSIIGGDSSAQPRRPSTRPGAGATTARSAAGRTTAGRPTGKPGARPAGKTRTPSTGKDRVRPAGKPGGQSEGKLVTGAARKPAVRPAGKPGGGASSGATGGRKGIPRGRLAKGGRRPGGKPRSSGRSSG